MKRIHFMVIVLIAFALMLPALGHALSAIADLPKAGGKPVLARINGEPLTLEEFERVLAGIHGGAADNTVRTMSKPSLLLDRLINAKLVLQEARNIGLDELPEVEKAQKAFEEETLRGMLYSYHVRNIRAADPKEVEKRYREEVKEVKVASVLFDKEEDAKRLEAGMKGGIGFDDLAKKAIDAGEAKGNVAAQYLKFASLNPEVANAVSSMKKGDVSPVIRIGKQFSLLRLEDVRYPQDKAARSRAEKEALQAKKEVALRKYAEGLRKKHAGIDRKLVDALDYESAESGFEKLRADGRLAATMKGESPVTVGELTVALEKKFFHGAERAAGGKKVNRLKDQVLDEILNRRVALMEAKKQRLERTDYFKVRAQENRNGVLFGAFVQKVIVPDVKVGEEELKEYYQAHIGEYTYPEMVRIESLVFSDKGAAEGAIEKLRKGADFEWLRANAEGQVDAANAKDLPAFRGELVTVKTLSDGIREAIAGSAAGDYRLYADPGKAYYVLDVRERVPSRPIPLESVKVEMEKKVFSEKIQIVLRDWEEKLRKASDVKIYATGKKLDRIVNPGAK